VIVAIHRDRKIFRQGGFVTVENAPGPPAIHVDDDNGRLNPVAVRANVFIGDLEFPVLMVDHDVLRLRARSRGRLRQIVDGFELVGARIPSNELGRDLRPEPHVHDPDYAVLVRSKPESIVSVPFFGGWISGVIFDATGSYAAAFTNGLAWNAFDIVILLLMRARQWVAMAQRTF
jgi:hypothetical protein